MADAGRNNSAFSVHFRDRWYRYGSTPDWSTVSIAALKYQTDDRWVVIALGSRGQLWELYPKGPIESLKQLPAEGEFTCVGAVGDALVVCGMGRTCFVRDVGGNWSDHSAEWPKPSEGVVGFTDISGRAFEDCVAVGWSGEVWQRRSRKWARLDSPTNANLNAVDVGSDGAIYCAGDAGVLVTGRAGIWSVVETGTDADLLDICLHDGELFACSSSEVLRLVDGELINDFAGGGDDVPRTCLKLASDGQGHLYSIGTHDVFRRSPAGWERLA